MDRIGTFKPIDFTFDEQVGLDLLIRQSWNPLTRRLLLEYAKFMLKTPDFENDKTCVPLQCADLLAWHVRRDYISPPEDHGRRRPEYIRLRESALLRITEPWPEPVLRQTVEKLRRADEVAGSSSSIVL
jgi:hypothetical protein